MDKSNTLNSPPSTTVANGIFIRGIVVSNRAKTFARKDGSGISVVVEHEIALQPGVVIWTRYLDPKIDLGLKLDGDKVLEYPKLKEFQTVNLKAQRIRTDEHTGQVIIKQGELID
jgi:hypothetical protein